MFDWFYEFLYGISKTLFRLIDGLISCANKLCGIEPINLNGEETDFLTYLLGSDKVGFAFRVSAILAIILLVIFTVFMIIRSIVKDKVEGTPAQIAVKAFKTLLTFFLVPLVIIAFMNIGNVFITALDKATSQNTASPGVFLFSAFAEDGGMDPTIAKEFRDGTLDYTNTDVVSQKMDISEYPFVFSWLAGGIVLFGIGSAMLVFVDRVLSIVILYIVAPLSISTSVLDDGARFKLWRDQFLSKFIMGYGMILAINIYAMVCGLVMNPEISFFGESFLDLLMKLLIIGGGAFTLNKSMALIGNLVSQGAGSNELRDTMSAGAIARMAKGVAGGTAGLPFRALGSILNDALAMKSRDIGASWLKKVGLGLSEGTSDRDGVKDPKSSSGAENNEKANYGSDSNNTKEAIKNGGEFKTSWASGGNNLNKNENNNKNDNKGNSNNSQLKQNKENPISNVINDGDNLKKEDKENNNNNNEGENK